MRLLLLSFNWVEYQVQMANALSARGHQCEVVFKASRVRESVGEALPDLLDPAVRWHLLDDRPAGLRDPRQWLTVMRLVRLLRRSRPDVMLLHEATTTYLPFCLDRGPGAPILLTVHDVSTHPGADSREPARRDRVRRDLRSRARAVVVHGDSLRRAYLAQQEDGPGAAEVHAIPHGCYTVLRHWARPGVAEIPRSILFFGRIHEYKGLDGRLRDVLSNPRCILHRGYLTNEKVAEVFQQSSIVVLPYIEGSQSGVVRIAYVFGKPVIVTNVGSIPESVRENVTGLIVPPRDPERLAAAMVGLLTDDDRRKTMAQAAFAMTEGELSWENVARRTEIVLQGMAPQTAKRSSGPVLFSAP
jgi:alpha-maltose-1-phosphate synthase